MKKQYEYVSLSRKLKAARTEILKKASALTDELNAIETKERKRKEQVADQKLKDKIAKMDLRYRKAYKSLQTAEKLIGEKGLYFALKDIYAFKRMKSPKGYYPKFTI